MTRIPVEQLVRDLAEGGQCGGVGVVLHVVDKVPKATGCFGSIQKLKIRQSGVDFTNLGVHAKEQGWIILGLDKGD